MHLLLELTLENIPNKPQQTQNENNTRIIYSICQPVVFL